MCASTPCFRAMGCACCRCVWVVGRRHRSVGPDDARFYSGTGVLDRMPGSSRAFLSAPTPMSLFRLAFLSARTNNLIAAIGAALASTALTSALGDLAMAPGPTAGSSRPPRSAPCASLFGLAGLDGVRRRPRRPPCILSDPGPRLQGWDQTGRSSDRSFAEGAGRVPLRPCPG